MQYSIALILGKSAQARDGAGFVGESVDKAGCFFWAGDNIILAAGY